MNRSDPPRHLRIMAAQTGPPGPSPAASVERGFELGQAAAEGRVDLIVFPELFTRPFWCVGASNPEYFSWAEPLTGDTVTTARRLARELRCHAVVPFFEKGTTEGEYYNSAALVGPDGELIPGRLPSGEPVTVYRKNAISSFNWGGSVNDEKYYFREGPGYPVFDTAIGSLGILICYDRWFSEAWSTLALEGAELVCVPNASMGSAAELFVGSIRTWAAQHVVYVIAANRAGCEAIEGTSTSYYGLSCVASPRGTLLAQAERDKPDTVAIAEIDREELRQARLDLTMYRDRRPELYGRLVTR